MTRSVKLDGKCDKTLYPLPLATDEEVYFVRYRDMTVPKPHGTITIASALASYRVAPNALLYQTNTENFAPDSIIAAFWFVKSSYLEFRKPVFYFYRPEQTLVVFPPVMSDGDLIFVSIEKADGEPVES